MLYEDSIFKSFKVALKLRADGPVAAKFIIPPMCPSGGMEERKIRLPDLYVLNGRRRLALLIPFHASKRRRSLKENLLNT